MEEGDGCRCGDRAIYDGLFAAFFIILVMAVVSLGCFYFSVVVLLNKDDDDEEEVSITRPLTTLLAINAADSVLTFGSNGDDGSNSSSTGEGRHDNRVIGVNDTASDQRCLEIGGKKGASLFDEP